MAIKHQPEDVSQIILDRLFFDSGSDVIRRR